MFDPLKEDIEETLKENFIKIESIFWDIIKLRKAIVLTEVPNELKQNIDKIPEDTEKIVKDISRYKNLPNISRIHITIINSYFEKIKKLNQLKTEIELGASYSDIKDKIEELKRWFDSGFHQLFKEF